MSEDVSIYCPTQAGTFQAYQPEYLDQVDGEWRAIPIKYVDVDKGMPFPRAGRGILDTIGLYGGSQAHAIAWQFAAIGASHGMNVSVRVVAYELQYDIKAKRTKEGKTLLFVEKDDGDGRAQSKDNTKTEVG